MLEIQHLSLSELEAGLDQIRLSPEDDGTLMLIVRRPLDNEREVVESAELDPNEGLVGDNWKSRGSKRTPDGSANINAQITIMNSNVIDLLARSEAYWSLAGDQLYIDLDLSNANLPTGTRLSIGTAVVQVTNEPHTGCGKFAERYGADATKFVNSHEGKKLRLRGINARIVQGGIVHVGDVVRKIS